MALRLVKAIFLITNNFGKSLLEIIVSLYMYNPPWVFIVTNLPVI